MMSGVSPRRLSRRTSGGEYAAAVFLALAFLALHPNGADGEPDATGTNYSDNSPVWRNVVGGGSELEATSVALGCGSTTSTAVTFADVKLTRDLPASVREVECRFALVSEATAWSADGGGADAGAEAEEAKLSLIHI